MIKAVIVINTLGKPRLSKFYEFQPAEKQQELIRHVYAVLSNRPGNVSNFIRSLGTIFGPDTRLVYKHYATLYFVFLFDNSENELAMLDLIQVKGSTWLPLDHLLMHAILDEIILGGQVLETDSAEVMRAVEEISKLESTTSAGTLINKSIPSWWAR